MRKHTRAGHHLRGKTASSVGALEKGFRYFRDVLPGGLRVVTVEAPHLHSALLAIYVRTGSRHEHEENNGASHFLEHMFFRGSHRFPDSVKMNAAVEDVGGNLNGVTTRDHGYYFTPLHPSHLYVGLDILGDMLTRPRLTQMNVEREIILEEMLDEVDDKGRDVEIDNLSKIHIFPEHPLSLKIAGTPNSVKSLTKTQLKKHFEKHYVTGNLVVTATGQVKRENVLECVEKAFRYLPEGPASTEESPSILHEGPYFRHIAHEESQTEFRMSFVTVPESHPDHAALQLIRRVLDDGLSSRLPFEIVERRGLAYSLHASLETFHDVGLFDIEAATAPAKAPSVIEEICHTLGELVSSGVTAGELLRAQRRHRMFLEFSKDSPGDLAGWFGGTELFHIPETFTQKCEEIENVTRKKVQEVARRYFSPKNLYITAVGPQKDARALSRVSQRATTLLLGAGR